MENRKAVAQRGTKTRINLWFWYPVLRASFAKPTGTFTLDPSYCKYSTILSLGDLCSEWFVWWRHLDWRSLFRPSTGEGKVSIEGFVLNWAENSIQKLSTWSTWRLAIHSNVSSLIKGAVNLLDWPWEWFMQGQYQIS